MCRSLYPSCIRKHLKDLGQVLCKAEICQEFMKIRNRQVLNF
jgi:hypothetical protein